ncbi:hypothetical protein HYV50_04120 [Candidatus Pacearchaeota archaeon]|nr:hypothetical protein [Candidatus Pacearchaeota archaeon]
MKHEQKMSREEIIGFHKGSINTLVAERNELIRIINVTENLISAHVKELEKLGVKIQGGSINTLVAERNETEQGKEIKNRKP